jgi:hypothetical protein
MAANYTGNWRTNKGEVRDVIPVQIKDDIKAARIEATKAYRQVR